LAIDSRAFSPVCILKSKMAGDIQFSKSRCEFSSHRLEKFMVAPMLRTLFAVNPVYVVIVQSINQDVVNLPIEEWRLARIHFGSSRPLACTVGPLPPIGSCSATENARAPLLPTRPQNGHCCCRRPAKKSLDDDKRTGKHRGGHEMLNATVRHFSQTT